MYDNVQVIILFLICRTFGNVFLLIVFTVNDVFGAYKSCDHDMLPLFSYGASQCYTIKHVHVL